MQFSSLLMALAASKAVSAQAFAAASANVNVDVSAVAAAAAGGPPPPPPAVPTYPPYPPGDNYPYPGCTTTSTHPATLTITDLTVSTYCPVCDEARNNGDVYVTTYETVYASICPTGLTSATYTVTQTCTGTTPIDYATCPPGFEAITTYCDVCAGSPTLTITQPCDCTAAVTAAYVTPYNTPYNTPYISSYATPYSSAVVYQGSAPTSNVGAVSALIGVVSVFLGMLLL